MPCDFFLYGYVMDTVFLLPLPQDLPLLQRIIPAISEIELYMQQHVWAEIDYQLDICHITKGRFLHMVCKEKFLESLFLSVVEYYNHFRHSKLPIL
jgi:hypothetical protein